MFEKGAVNKEDERRVPGVAEEAQRASTSSQAQSRRPQWQPFAAAGLCLLFIALQLRFGLNLMDEGFLWYGAQRMAVGELPLRDFQAYDPGRYFWSAAWMSLLGDNGIIALRSGNALLSAITVGLATWLVRSGSGSADRGTMALLVSGVVFALWMVPGFKAADAFAVMILLAGLTRLLQGPGSRTYFEAGFCWGVAAMIGINHGLYGAIAGLLAFIYLRGAPKPAVAIAASFLGAVVGYAPVLALHFSARGFSEAFVDSIRMIFEAGMTNFPLPFPRLLGFVEFWRHPLMAPTETALALLFLGVPLLWAAMVWRLRAPRLRASVPPQAVAGFLLSLPYAHYAYSRADASHVAIAILPVLVIMLTYASAARRARQWLMLAPILAVTLLITAHMHPGYAHLRGLSSARVVDVGGDRLFLAPETATVVLAVEAVAEAAGENQFFAGPYLPGAYALSKRRSPTWENYMIFPASPRRQLAEIRRLESAAIRYAIIRDERWDRRQDLGLARTHPLVLAFLRRCLPQSGLISGGANPLLLRMRSGPGCRD